MYNLHLVICHWINIVRIYFAALWKFLVLLYLPCEDFASMLHSSESNVHPQDFIGPLKHTTEKYNHTLTFIFNKLWNTTHEELINFD